MTRAFSSVCLLLTLVLGGSVAFAKDKIAILGLEVVSGSSGFDAESVKVASELTTGLRSRPKAGQGPFAFTPGSEKELIEEKVNNSCDEKEDCMTTIGRNLGATHLLYGKLEKKSLGAQTGYQVSLKLLKIPGIGAGQISNRWTEFIPVSESQGPKLLEWARKGYKRITNDATDGKLVVTANVDRGTILLDGKPVGNIVNKRGEVEAANDGKFTLAVEAAGFQRWESEEKVTIRGGETTTIDAKLSELRTPTEPVPCDPRVATCEGTVSDTASSGSGWRKTAYITGGTTVLLAGAFAYSWKQLSSTGGSFPDYGEKCIGDKQPKACGSGSTYTAATYVTGIGMGVVGTIAIVAIYKGFVSKKESPVANTSVGRQSKKQSRLAVTPVVGPQGAGATLRFDW